MIKSFRVTKTDIKKAVMEIASSSMYQLSTNPQYIINRLYECLELSGPNIQKLPLEQVLSMEDSPLELSVKWSELTSQFIVTTNQPFIKGAILSDTDLKTLHKELVEAIKQSEFVVNDSYDIDSFL